MRGFMAAMDERFEGSANTLDERGVFVVKVFYHCS